jgi:GntR family transcriptional regulator
MLMVTARVVCQTGIAKATKTGERTAVSPRSRAAAGPGGVPERRDVYEWLADELRQAITSGQYKPGDRMPSTLDLMAKTGVANLTVRGAYRVLIEEGLIEPVPKRGFYVRRSNRMTWRMNPGAGSRKASAEWLDRWAADADAAGLVPAQQITVAIEDASAVVAGQPAGERLALPSGARVLVRRTIRSTSRPGSDLPPVTDSLSDEYFPYELVSDTALASPAPASAFGVLAELGHRLRRHHDELRPRVATAEERRLMDLPQVSVVLELARTGYDADGMPVIVVHQVRRSDGATFNYDIAYPGR